MENNNDDSSNKDSSNNRTLFIILLVIAGFSIISFAVVWFRYFNFFSGTPYSTNPNDWGVFGDYFGGVLNPILSFLTIILLLYTIKQTSDALQQSKEELILSREAIEATKEELHFAHKTYDAQKEALQIQNNYIQQQNFENHFFSLFSILKEKISSFEYDGAKGYSAYSKLCNILNFKIRSTKFSQNGTPLIMPRERLENMPLFETILSNLLFFISETSIINNKQKWVEIVKSILHNNHYLLLCQECIYSNFKNEKLIQFYEEFSFFDRIFYSNQYEIDLIKLMKSLERINLSAFGESETDS